MSSFTYLFIRMWAPPDECSDPGEAHYVQRLAPEGQGVSWTVTRKYEEACIFKSMSVASRVINNVTRLVERIKRGWLYEIILVEEEIVETNVPEEARADLDQTVEGAA